MAKGTPVGTIYAEIDLDTDKYTKSQQKLLQGVTSISLDIEKNFQNLGTHCASSFDLMRQKIQNSYLAILNSSQSTTNDIMRAEEAKNAKLAALNAQQFGAHTSFIDQMKANWIAASAAVVGAWMLVNRAVAFMDEGAKALQVESSFKIMAESSGAAADEMIASMKRATRGTIEESQLMQKAVKLMTLGYDSDQIERFSKVVITASQIAGTSAAEAYDNLADAISTRMPRALVRMGSVTREQMQIVTAAIKAGASETALYELAMANLELKQLMLQGTMDQATVSMQQFHARTKETREFIGKELIAALEIGYRLFQMLGGSILQAAGAYAKYRELIYTISGDEAKAAQNREFANTALAAGNKLIEESRQLSFLQTAEGKRATADEISGAQAGVAAQVARLKAIADAAKGAKDITKAAMDENKKIYDMEVEQAENAAKMKTLAGENAWASELNFALATFDAKEQAMNRWYNRDRDILNASVLLEGVKKAKLDALWADYEKQLSKLDSQRKIKRVDVDEFMTKAGQSYVAWDIKQEEAMAASHNINAKEIMNISAETWDAITEYQRLSGKKMTDNERADAKLTLDLYKETLVGGVKSALYEISDESENIGKLMGDATKRTFDSMTDSLTEFCMTGKMNFTDFANSVIRDLIKIQIRAGITGPLSGWLTGLFGGRGYTQGNMDAYGNATGTGWEAKGDAFYGGNVIPFARGGIVHKPTLFPMAKGTGLMGEAGPEAIMPLARTSTGALGVKAAGGSPQSVKVVIVNPPGQENKVTNAQAGFDGQQYVVTVWLDALNRNVGGLRTALGG